MSFDEKRRGDASFVHLPVQDPVAVMRKAHEEKLTLCDCLEEIADSLPNKIDRRVCLNAANALVPLLRNIHRYEEEIVFPVFEGKAAGRFGTGGTIARLKAEHLEDESYADELAEALVKMSDGSSDLEAETAGFMLRGFFESLRRHMAFERDHILAIIEGVL